MNLESTNKLLDPSNTKVNEALPSLPSYIFNEVVLLNWYVQESRYRSPKRNILAKRYLGRYVPRGEDCFADLLKAAKYASNPYYLQGKVISQVLSKPWPVVSAIIHPQSFLANFVLLSSNLQGLTLSSFFRIPN